GDFYVYFDYATGLLKSRIQAPPSVQVDVSSNNNFWQYFNTWFHYAFTWGSDGMKMYLNGELQSDQNSLTYSALNNNYNFYIGAHGYMLHNGSYVVADFFDGQIDELRIWNYQKTSETILALRDAPLDSSYFVTIDSGLVGYWRFDDLEDLDINNDGVDDVRDFSVLQNHLDLAGNAHLVPSNIVLGEPIIFEQTYGGINSERGIILEVTSDGGYMLVGSTSSFTSDQDMYIIKLDSTGSLAWSKVYHSPGFLDRLNGVQQTVDGDYYLSGYMEGGFGFVDHVIMKVNEVGNIIWAKHFGGVEADELREITIAADGGALVSGYNASHGAGAKDVQAIKFSSNGDVDWARTYGKVWEDFTATNILISDGNYLLVGATDVSGSYSIRPLLIKIDSTGTIIWSKVYSGFSEDWTRFAIETNGGGFLIAGDTRSYGLGGSQDIYLIKTDAAGEIIWAKAYGG
ncbi:MAG: LamG domain-containing protein, partial [Cyclobacteriaceae bacterium]|nr:LamG domain-containing protein [Cyclobacteriaceae bacterium]